MEREEKFIIFVTLTWLLFPVIGAVHHTYTSQIVNSERTSCTVESKIQDNKGNTYIVVDNVKIPVPQELYEKLQLNNEYEIVYYYDKRGNIAKWEVIE